MPSPDHRAHHGPGEDSARLEALSLLALGEPSELERHVEGCAECRSELSSLRRTVELGRTSGAGYGDGPAPSEAVWAGISAELGLEEPVVRAGRRTPPRPPWRRRAGLAAAAVLIAAAGLGGGYAIARHQGSPAVAASATLAQIAGGPTGVHGSATVHRTSTGQQLSVRTSNLPLRNGYYEVWLFDPVANKMVAVGTLPRTGTATYPVPPGLDVTSYHLVDVSAQDYNGNPAHQQSVLRGGLTW
ncbi:anti-sigma factor domain-containing protein [Allobranchiibius huperziae]|uniref:Anti-sigma K factor RskA C-terminal domain-containing protein n=1 Tax=Allobranchiibius huperziae TaxID=1874116 RepID=A0A853D8D7_9MICO|nr:hypothetical protein [Allobranchiibius huperziae]